jgi:hypothetical protein
MTIGLMHVLVAYLKQHFPAFGKMADGTPIIIFGNGEWHKRRMHSTQSLAGALLRLKRLSCENRELAAGRCSPTFSLAGGRYACGRYHAEREHRVSL